MLHDDWYDACFRANVRCAEATFHQIISTFCDYMNDSRSSAPTNHSKRNSLYGSTSSVLKAATVNGRIWLAKVMVPRHIHNNVKVAATHARAWFALHKSTKEWH
ncbi:hypothetical protein ACHHYP_20222 [Achlya hypogyna]|uniref:Uncharacterized protein n=1 Tax=Achlya hypogyna TaxID=1202772 RepID=A0A1V9ZNQ6_ACHHY|nr:hypothetical protein ACHHYP_20222 [Achlya hypogyna]